MKIDWRRDETREGGAEKTKKQKVKKYFYPPQRIRKEHTYHFNNPASPNANIQPHALIIEERIDSEACSPFEGLE